MRFLDRGLGVGVEARRHRARIVADFSGERGLRARECAGRRVAPVEREPSSGEHAAVDASCEVRVQDDLAGLAGTQIGDRDDHSAVVGAADRIAVDLVDLRARCLVHDEPDVGGDGVREATELGREHRR